MSFLLFSVFYRFILPPCGSFLLLHMCVSILLKIGEFSRVFFSVFNLIQLHIRIQSSYSIFKNRKQNKSGRKANNFLTILFSSRQHRTCKGFALSIFSNLKLSSLGVFAQILLTAFHSAPVQAGIFSLLTSCMTCLLAELLSHWIFILFFLSVVGENPKSAVLNITTLSQS